MPHKLILTIFAAVMALGLQATSISGTIVDETGEALPEATVRLLAARDSSYVKGTASNLQGQFRLQEVKAGKYILAASYIGYTTKYTDITVGDKALRLGNITLGESSVLLKEATVTAVKTPVKVMEDTIEYNADSYKTQPNAVVEDLLKRLPGVEVDSEGKITANGKEVTKILVDGREFFSDDPKVASKNLPVDMVDKLQVVDRKSDLARLTGVDDGEDETVINLTVKKDMKDGLAPSRPATAPTNATRSTSTSTASRMATNSPSSVAPTTPTTSVSPMATVRASADSAATRVSTPPRPSASTSMWARRRSYASAAT